MPEETPVPTGQIAAAPTPELPVKTNPLDALSRSITILSTAVGVVGAIIAAIAGINAILTAKANEQLAKYTAFRQVVTAEEGYWKTLYIDYQASFGNDVSTDMRDAKRLAIVQFANHGIPDFAEFDVSPAAKTGVQQELTAIKGGLTAALSSRGASGPAASDAQSVIDYNAHGGESKAVSSTAQAATDRVAIAVQQANPLATQTLTTTVLSAGRPSGWDVDVFWCRGPNESATYATASAAANALAQASGANRAIAPGVMLGRVRLRPLPLEINSQAGYGIKGNVLRPEDIPAERAAGAAILATVNAAQPAVFSIPKYATNRTPWYISVFACAA